MKKYLFICLGLIGLSISVWATVVYPRVCVCSCPRLNLWCFKCRHFAVSCPRYWRDRNEFGQRIPPFRPSCLVSRYDTGISVSCPTCHVSIIEGGR